jgi:hypothetical protein
MWTAWVCLLLLAWPRAAHSQITSYPWTLARAVYDPVYSTSFGPVSIDDVSSLLALATLDGTASFTLAQIASIASAIKVCNAQQQGASLNLNGVVLCDAQVSADLGYPYVSYATLAPGPTVDGDGQIIASSQVASFMNCGDFTATQCQQLQTQAVTQCMLCENSGADCLFNDNVIRCGFLEVDVAVQAYVGSVLGFAPDNSLVPLSWNVSLDTTLASLAPYFAVAFQDSINVVANYIPFSGDTGYYNSITNGCGTPFGNDPVFPCSGHGTCSAGFYQSYCICQPGYSGQFCDQEETEADSTCGTYHVTAVNIVYS